MRIFKKIGLAAAICTVIFFIGLIIKIEFSNANGQEKEAFETSDESVQIICERVSSIDFEKRVYSIDAVIYNSEKDNIYREAYLSAITGETPVEFNEDELFYKDILRGTFRLSENEFLKVLENAGYYYLDYDGDGLPELVIELDEPTVLKYNPEENKVSIIDRGYDKWHFLSPGQMYYFDPTSANRIVYGYADNVTDKNVIFEIYYGLKNSEWRPESYMVSVDGFEQIDIGNEKWDEITEGFFKAIENPGSPLSFEEVFASVAGDFLQSN